MALNDNAILTPAQYLLAIREDPNTPQVGTDHLEFVINAVSDFLERELGRKIVTPAAAITEDFYGTGADTYFVKNCRILSLTSIAYWTGTEWETMTAADYPRETDTDGGSIWLTDGTTFARKTRYRVVYTTGWDIADVPPTIQEAVVLMTLRLTKKFTGAEGISSESVAGGTTGLDLQVSFTDDIKRKLRSFYPM